MRVFTIGYEGASPDRFVEALRDAGVGAVADLRAVALSRKRGFSKSALKAGLLESGVDYRHFVDLGTPKAGREAARAGDGEGLRRIYAEQLAKPEAQAALDALGALARDRPVCLLCFERDPRLCHRRIVAERLGAMGFEAVDLTVPG